MTGAGRRRAPGGAGVAGRALPDAGDAVIPAGHGAAAADDPESAPAPLDCALADKYRRRLRWLPAEQRAAYGDEMLEVFLAAARDADPENADLTYRLGSPGWKETWALVALALRLRWTEPVAGRYAVRAAGLRLFARAGLVLLAAWSLVLAAGSVAFLLDPPADWAVVSRGVTPWQQLFPGDWWSFVQNWAYLAWLGALLVARSGTGRRLWWASLSAAIPVMVLAAGIVVDEIRYGGSLEHQSIGWLVVEGAVLTGSAVRAGYARVVEQAGAVRRSGVWRDEARASVTARDSMTSQPPVARASAAAQTGNGAEPSYAVDGRFGRLSDPWWAVAIGAGWTGALWALMAWRPGNSVAYALAPLTDEVGLWTVTALAVGIVVVTRRPARGDPLVAGFSAAGLAIAAGLMQVLRLPDWIAATGADADVPGAVAAVVVCLMAMGAMAGVAASALVVGHRRRSDGERAGS